ncbi:MAG: DUF4831 family protein [Candidatus Competibacteraceae bacterium]|nr:DUF4831 family protein [Candidatus Competibacteraceae bacterium]
MQLKWLIFAFFLTLTLSCSHSYYRVEHVNNPTLGYVSKKSGLYYYLPLTIVEVDVQIKKITRIPGPLSEFSETHIGYTGIMDKSENYEIADIRMKSVTAPDPQQLYFIHGNKNQKYSIELASNGILYSINNPITQLAVQQTIREEEKEMEEKDRKNIQLTLLNLKEKSDTIYTRQILEGGVVVENRQIERVLTKSSKSESAKDAVKLINDIRAQKYNLISYNEELAYPAATLELMLKELNRLEDEYLTLFLGTTEIQYLNYRYNFIPQNDNKGFQPLFKFNPGKGVSDSLKLIMETAYIKHDPAGYTLPVEKFSVYDAFEKHGQGIVYRMPEKTSIRIVLNNRIIATSELWISQLGTLQRLPAYNLDKLKMIFDSESGNIRHFSIDN